jgi:hypothetical protein
MKYWRLVSAAVALSVFLVAVINLREERLQMKRDAAYQAILHSYTEAFKPGMTRKEVEDLLRDRNDVLRRMCCVDIKKPMDVGDDLVKIGQEKPPWVCSEKNIYIAFQFTGTRAPAAPPSAESSDRLTAVAVYTWLERCV